MKKNYLMLAVLALSTIGLTAQIDPFTDGMETYTPGSPVNENWWTSWDGSDGAAGTASADQARNGAQSYYVDDTGVTDPVLDLGSKIFGEWYLNFYMYVPSDKEAYWNIQGEVPIGAGQWVVGNIFFNQDLASPGEGSIDNSALGAVTFTFPHDEWFLVSLGWDINAGIAAATWNMSVDGNEVIPAGTAFTDSAGTTATSLGGINFFSISTNNTLYIDDMEYSDEPISTSGVSDLEAKGLSVFPNPVANVLNVQAREAISSVAIYNVLGQQVYAANVNALSSTIDMSAMASGAYFVKVNIAGQEGTVKVIK